MAFLANLRTLTTMNGSSMPGIGRKSWRTTKISISRSRSWPRWQTPPTDLASPTSRKHCESFKSAFYFLKFTVSPLVFPSSHQISVSSLVLFLSDENKDDFPTILKTSIKTLKKQIDTSASTRWFGSERRGIAGNSSGGMAPLPPKPDENDLLRAASLQALSEFGPERIYRQ